MAALNSPTPGSRNPFITPPMTNNPFLRKHEQPQQIAPQPPSPMSSTPATQAPEPAVAPSEEPVNIAIPPSPPPQVSEPPRQPSPPLRHDNATDEPVSNPPFLSEDEALEAAIQASLSLNDGPTPPPTGPPPPLPARTATLQPPDLPPRSASAEPPSSRSPVAYPTSPFEEPPAYTPGPDALLGEATVEMGPRRPFQNTPARPPPPTTGWSGYPGAMSRQQTGAPYLNPQGTGWGGSNSQPDLSIPGGHGPHSVYAPPPGPPPPRSAGGASSNQGPTSTSTSTANDGTPTVQPMPGRPFLHNGQTLVYPQGYYCHKCNNTGYKSFDPSHPCRKCWQKYGKTFTGPLTYAPWANRSADTNFQRPLPQTRGPPRPTHNTTPARSSWGGSDDLYRGISNNRTGFNATPLRGAPPPGSLVVQPGDPRIGGRRCWNCGGDGVISLFFFDSERCPTCNGLGRIV